MFFLIMTLLTLNGSRKVTYLLFQGRSCSYWLSWWTVCYRFRRLPLGESTLYSIRLKCLCQIPSMCYFQVRKAGNLLHFHFRREFSNWQTMGTYYFQSKGFELFRHAALLSTQQHEATAKLLLVWWIYIYLYLCHCQTPWGSSRYLSLTESQSCQSPLLLHLKYFRNMMGE